MQDGDSQPETRDNNGLHTESFLGQASMLCFLYGPGEPGRYHARSLMAKSKNTFMLFGGSIDVGLKIEPNYTWHQGETGNSCCGN